MSSIPVFPLFPFFLLLFFIILLYHLNNLRLWEVVLGLIDQFELVERACGAAGVTPSGCTACNCEYSTTVLVSDGHRTGDQRSSAWPAHVTAAEVAQVTSLNPPWLLVQAFPLLC